MWRDESEMTTRISRATLLSRSAKGGLALAVGVTSFESQTAPAKAAGNADDVPYVVLAVAAAQLGAAFYGELSAAKLFDAAEGSYFKRALENERDHYTAMAKALSDAGVTAAQPGDFDITFPRDAFSSRMSSARVGMKLEKIFLGIYLGGVASVQDRQLQSTMARIAASHGEHLGLLRRIARSKPVGASFPAPLSLEEASTALEGFIS
jgi:Ferritin-like domain